MTVTIFWDETSCSLEDFYRRFGGSWCFHLQGIKSNPSKQQACNCWNEILHWAVAIPFHVLSYS